LLTGEDSGGFFILLSIAWLIFGTVGGWHDKNFATEFFQVGVAPIVVIYLLGVAFVWIIEGFARAES